MLKRTFANLRFAHGLVADAPTSFANTSKENKIRKQTKENKMKVIPVFARG